MNNTPATLAENIAYNEDRIEQHMHEAQSCEDKEEWVLLEMHLNRAVYYERKLNEFKLLLMLRDQSL